MEGDISPSIADPALLSVVGVVDGSSLVLSERNGPGFSAFKASADQPAQRTRPLTSSPRSWSRGSPTKSRSLSLDSPTRKVGSAFFRTHVYCDSSPCLTDPALLSVVGFCGQSEYCKVAG